MHHLTLNLSRAGIGLLLGLAIVVSNLVTAASPPQVKNDDGTVAKPSASGGTDPQGIDAERLYAALVRVQATAVPNARSSSSLGREREGTGTIIGKDGVILTIGYLLIEADNIK
ncbi:MAG TPA: hypothetical protein VNE58_16275, partial [Casimicrobiaceae bacterium]|nr:hypothetical protein [Casimicrobiaceae bacterium]